MRLKPQLLVAATMLATSANFAVGGPATAADEPANLSDFLAAQLPGLTGQTTVMVHGSSISQADPTATPADIERALKVSAYKYTDGAGYQAGALGTTSYDKGYGLVDVVTAAEALG